MDSDIIHYFAQRSATYNQAGWVKDEGNLELFVESLNSYSMNPLTILDLGAGTGALSKYILNARNADDEITALDISADMIMRINSPKVKTIIAPVEDLPIPDNSYDAVVSRQCLHYSENIDKAIAEVARVLKRGGLFTLGQFVPYDGDSKPFWVHMMKIRQPLRRVFFTEKEWIAFICERNFRLIRNEELEQRYSMREWIQLYFPELSDVEQVQMLSRYLELIKNAPNQFIDAHKITVEGEDFFSSRQMCVLSFAYTG